MAYNRRYRARRGRRNLRRGRFNKRKALGYRKKVAGIIHPIKRLGRPMFIQNTAAAGGGPQLTNDGAGSMFMGTPVPGQLPGTWEAGISTQFQLSSCLDFADLTALFDRYKIVGVALKIQYLQNASFIPGVANLPTLHYAFDGDDATTPGTALLVLAKGYCKTRTLNANRPLSVYVKPRITKEVYNSPLSTGYTSEKACYLDCASDSVPHFGLKMWLSDWVGGAENNNAIRIQPIYYLKMRDTQ